MQAPFPWGQFRTSRVHAAPVPPPSALSLPTGAHLARVWWRRPKTKFVLLYKTLPIPRGWGGGGCNRPMAEATHTPQPLAPPSKLQTYTHTHTHARVCTWEGGSPGGWGGKGRRRRRRPSPQTTSAPSQEKCITGLAAAGSTEVPSTPLPHARAQPPDSGALPAAVCPLKLHFFLSVSHSPPSGAADLRSFDGGTWLRRAP